MGPTSPCLHMHEAARASGEEAGFLGVGRGRAAPKLLTIKTALGDRRLALLRSGASGGGLLSRVDPDCASPPHPGGRAHWCGGLCSAEESPVVTQTRSTGSFNLGFRGGPLPHFSLCFFAPRFVLRFSPGFAAVYFCIPFPLASRRWSEAALVPLPLFILPCSDNPPFLSQLGGLGSVHPTPRCQPPAARGRAPRNSQRLHI